MGKFNSLFQPLEVRRCTIPNRIVMTPMGTNFAENTGEMSFLHIDYYEQRAQGGAGLIIVENACVDYPAGSNGTTQLRLDLDSYIPRMFKLTETIHKHDTKIAVQLNHAGASLCCLKESTCSQYLLVIYQIKKVEQFPMSLS